MIKVRDALSPWIDVPFLSRNNPISASLEAKPVFCGERSAQQDL
jgi:hypothetical protein